VAAVTFPEFWLYLDVTLGFLVALIVLGEAVGAWGDE
jgi:hypothetical protein